MRIIEDPAGPQRTPRTETCTGGPRRPDRRAPGLETLRNGDLIRNAVQDGYDLLITCDQSIRFQQNLIRQPITVLTITTNDWNTIRTNLSLVRSAIDMAQQGENNLLRLGPPP